MTALATVYAGDSLQFQVTVTDEDGNAIDLAGGSARYALARSPDSAALVTKDSDNVGEINLLVDGVVEVNLDPADTASLDEGTYYHEVEIVTADDETVTGLAEYLIVRKTVL